MKKLLLTAAIAVFAMMGTQAQEGFKLGAHVGLPVGDYSAGSSLNVGADLSYHWNITEGLDIGAATGYTTFLAKNDGDAAGFIPIAASGRYSFNEEWFVGADLGYALGLEEYMDGGFYYQLKGGYKFSDVEVFAFYKGISSSYDVPGIYGGSFTYTLGSTGVGAAYRF